MAFPRSLKSIITLTTLAIFMGGLWSLSYFASRMLREDMERLLGEQQFSTASIVADQINYHLESRLKALDVAATQSSRAMQDGPAGMQDFIEQRMTLQGLFNGGLIVLDAGGTAIAEVPLATGRRGANFLNIEEVAITLREGKGTVTRAIMSKTLNSPAFGIQVPIHDSRGKVIGALAGITNLGQPNFLGQIANTPYGKTGGYLLIAPQHRLVVTATDKRRVMETLPAAGVNPTIDRLLAGHEGSAVMINPIGQEVLVSDKAIPVAEWILAATLPTEDAFAPIREMQRRMLLATLLLTLLAGGLTWWVLQRQLSPMSDTVEALVTMSETNQPLRPLPISRQDEIGRLIGGFNHLLETLDQRGAALKDKNEALERSNAELESFAYVASHDLREPLRNVTAFSTMLARRLEGRLDNDEQDLLTIITDAASRMDALVRDLLEVSRVGQGERTIQPVALGEALHSALESLRLQIETAGATVEAPPDLPVVMGDAEELYRVFLNAIGNALKYRHAAPPVIRVGCAPDGPAAWRFQIHDNGIGIETGHGYEERIFGLFQRLHQRDEYGGGTGIGLPICRKIIIRHGGQVWVESEGLGKGMSFIFTLPMNDSGLELRSAEGQSTAFS
ncbi:MAG: ATP-binding protein [Phaeospirillum sp.]|nr:ATP-binding protein [Phaeospirillum sp.]